MKNNRDFQHQKGDQYLVTGVLPNGKRFKPIRTVNHLYAINLELGKGSKVWQIRKGKKKLILFIT